jgi:2-polyprenyl-3-methyl-5-hydroxy-6-metoxy-1,4-benzoquinol methylase
MIHEHKFTPSDKKGYEVCQCGTYHSTELLSPKELYENNYWNGDTRSLLKDQIINVTETSCGVSKVDKVLKYIKPFGDVLEVGCAPAWLMKVLLLNGNNVIGIEPDEKNIPELMNIAGDGAVIIHGYFPMALGNARFDNIVATDIVEHIEDYKGFIEAARDLLKDGGSFIFMSPIIENGVYRDIDLKSDEHAWIFSKEYLQEYLSSIFSEVVWDRWRVGHEMFVCYK